MRVALLGAGRMVATVSDVGWGHGSGCGGDGGSAGEPADSRNVVPGSVFFTIELRHPSDEVVAAMEAEMRQKLERIAADAGVEITPECVWDSPAVRFDAACIASVRRAAGGGVSEPRAGLGGRA
jgi:beta-ureidopropionase / N-carbamoyl-L-amino-acid hydrolase